MRGALNAALIMIVLFVVSVLFGQLSGGATTRLKSSGELIGQHLSYHSERESVSVEILGGKLDNNGYPVFKKGQLMEFIVKPGKSGVHTGFQIENAVSGLRIDGNHCRRGGDGDFCSTTYQCIDEDSNRCSIAGSKCWGDKLAGVRLPEDQKSGKYVVTVCEANDYCCKNEVRSKPFVIE